MRYGEGKLKVVNIFIVIRCDVMLDAEAVPAGQALLPVESGFSGYHQDTILAVNVGSAPYRGSCASSLSRSILLAGYTAQALLNMVAALFALSFGISAWKQAGGERWALR
jgi:hypothetical protein